MCFVFLGVIFILLLVMVILVYCCNGFGRVEFLLVCSCMFILFFLGVNLKVLDRMFRIILLKFIGFIYNFKWLVFLWWNCKVICFLFVCFVKVLYKLLMNLVILVLWKMSDICFLFILCIFINWFISCRIFLELCQMMWQFFCCLWFVLFVISFCKGLMMSDIGVCILWEMLMKNCSLVLFICLVWICCIIFCFMW